MNGGDAFGGVMVLVGVVLITILVTCDIVTANDANVRVNLGTEIHECFANKTCMQQPKPLVCKSDICVEP
jgi:hypothetical protein